MAWTQDDADALKSSIAAGVKDVQYSDGSRIVYRSLAEMRETLALIEAEVAGSSVTRVRTIRFGTSKGF